MKVSVFILFTFGLCSCSHKMLQQASFEGRCYKSAGGHLFAGNQICFYPDSAFKYIGHGPATFISLGKWKYNNLSNEIELISHSSNNVFQSRVDSMWIDLAGKRIKVRNNENFLLERVVYKLQ